jgi:hypothetical protein
MDNSDRIFFSKFAIDPEDESIFEYDDFFDFNSDGVADRFKDKINYVDSDDFLWDKN